MLAELRGGCLAPVGALAQVLDDGRLQLNAAVMEQNGGRRITAADTDVFDAPDVLGRRVAQSLIAHGAAALISAARDSR